MDIIKKILFSVFLMFFTSLLYADVGFIKFGVLNFYPPFVFSAQGGQIYGFDIELAQTICQKINAQCTFTQMPLVSLFESLKEGKIDAIISAINATPERKKIFDFTDPYYSSTMSYVGATNSNILISPEGLKNKTIGVLKASIFYTYLTQNYPNIVAIKTYRTVEGAFDDLSKGLLDLVMLDTPTARYWIQSSQNMFKFVGDPVSMPPDEGYAIVVNKDNTQLLTILNAQLNLMKQNGEINKLEQKYFGL